MRSLGIILKISILFVCANAAADPIPVANHSFEYPVIDPVDNPFYAIPIIAQWREIDLDTEQSSFTGTFKNTPVDANDHIWNPDGDQLGLLGNGAGNRLEQELSATYEIGKSYQLTVATCLSTSYTPAPGSSLKLAFYYIYGTEFIEIGSALIPIESVTTRTMRDFSLTIGPVEETHQYAGKNIGISIRSVTPSGFGYWDLDNIRLVEMPLSPDFTGDNFVNLEDFTVFALDWLSCSQVSADLTGEGCVDGQDLIILMESWLNNV